MTTSAGMCNSTITKGSQRRSIVLFRPMATPRAAPKIIAMAKAEATRASVAARFKKSAPERASLAIAERTESGAGSMWLAAMVAPNCQATSSKTSGASLTKSGLALAPRRVRRLIKCSFVEFGGIAYALRASGFGKAAVEFARVSGFFCDGAARNALDIGLPVEREFSLVRDPEPLPYLFPSRVGMGENFFCFRRGREEAGERGRMGFGKVFAKDIADHRHWPLHAQTPFGVIHGKKAA